MFEPYIVVSNGQVVAKVRVKDVLYIERYLRKIRIVTSKEIYEYYDRLENIQPFLDARFYPCLEGCYVNFEQVKAMGGQKIIFENDMVFYLGRANFVKSRQAFKKYLINRLELNKSACNYKGDRV